ncbi:MAG: BlaI/MecI/CopY family transcriptional regulator [Bacteroidales bacterium]|nr:BlaI/MecI/CopY family transcriptional regulator [Bacteroidales bacterium]
MMSKPDKNPTPAELEILLVLWEESPRTVKEVHEILSSKKDVGYTTTLKIMQNMNAKGMLNRKMEGRGHVYFPVLKKEETQEKLVNRFLNTTFEGSASKLVMQVLGNHQTSSEELQKIKDLINQIEKK